MTSQSGDAVLVTGAASGIGRAVAHLFSERGWIVAAADRDAGGLEDTVANSASPDRVSATILDVRDPSSVEGWAARVESDGRHIRALVAAAALGDSGRIDEMDPDVWEQVLEVGLRGTTNCCRAAIPRMRANGGGAIVTFGSVLGRAVLPGCGAYAATKAGIEGLTRALAADHGPEAIRVNCVLPGSTNTPMMWLGLSESEIPEARRRHELDIPLRRVAEPPEIARVVYFLASDESGYVNGASVVVDGGLAARIASSVC